MFTYEAAAPVLAPIGDRSVDEGVALSFTAVATDADVPADVLRFSLDNEPVGAAIDAVTGEFSWTPTEADGPGLFTFDVVVTDDDVPALADRETITVTVTEVNDEPVALISAGSTVVEGSTLALDGSGSSDVDGSVAAYAWSVTSGAVLDDARCRGTDVDGCGRRDGDGDAHGDRTTTVQRRRRRSSSR